MKLSTSLCEAYNQQILHELGNASKYMQIASFFEDLQLNKIADYFKKQSDDEKQHANKFMNHINDRVGGKVSIGEVDSPNLELTDCSSVGDVYLKVEEETTASIEGLYDLALSEKSYIDLGFLTDMLQEQIEEEDSADKFRTRIQSVKDYILFDATFSA